MREAAGANSEAATAPSAHEQDPAAYGDAYADVYDDWYSEISDVAATVAALRDLTPGRRLLELGVGTGRIALPLAEAGFTITGIDASQAMLDALRTKPGSDAIDARLTDMATLDGVEGPFDIVLVTFNTLFNLTTEAAQISCLRRVADELAPLGRFVIEAFVPSPDPEGPETGEEQRSDGDGGTVVTRTHRDPATQVVDGEHIHRGADGSEHRRAWRIRYLHIDQLDDLCAQAGLRLVGRWADWTGAESRDTSPRHVSAYALR
ncbi:MAG: class I SAM-dependent methyltransferase [Actinomycetota bacterium]